MDHKTKSKPIMTDPMIIPRVKQYLEEHIHQTYIDVGQMASDLQARYREYNRRKIEPFRVLVGQAYKTVLQSYGIDSNPSTDSDDGNSDLELMEDNPAPANHMNNMLTNLYANNAKQGGGNDNELIDISSDESGEEGTKQTKNKAAKDKHVNANNPPLLGNKVLPELVIKKLSRPFDQQPIESCPLQKKRRFESPENLNANGKIQTQNPLLNLKTIGRKYTIEYAIKSSKVTFKDIGGCDKILANLCESLFHMKHPEIYRHIGLPPSRGFLLHGPPGSGKTLLAQAIAGQLQVAFIHISATELIAGVSGESEERIREVFEQAACVAPSVLFIDEIDAISSNRVNAQKDMERRIVAQLLTSFDGLSTFPDGDQVVVIGATNRADSLDPALRRLGRFDHEICLGIPDRLARISILKVICSKLRLEDAFDFDAVAALTPGYVGADLLALASRAASIAVKRVVNAKKPTKYNIVTKLDKIVSQSPLLLCDVEIDPEKKDENRNIEKSANSEPVDEMKVQNGEVEKVSEESEKTTETLKVVEIRKEIVNESGKDNETPMDVEEIKTSAEIEKNKTDDLDGVEVIEDTKKSEDEKVEETPKKEGQEKIDEVLILEDDETVNENPTSTTEKTDETKNQNETDDIMEIVDLESVTVEESASSIVPSASEDATDLSTMLNWLSTEQSPIDGKELENLFITLNDFCRATKLIQPSAKREGFITVPDVTWSDIGSLQDIREELKLAVLAPVKFPEKLEALGLLAPSGVLLCGPPGCGKTLLAKAVANEAGINFISVKGPELLNMYVGESERAVRQCFQRARNSAPCVIFFDEFDSLCPKRSDSAEGGASMRVVNQLLTEMDGFEGRKGVYLMAASNRPDIIDPAVLRPGRLDKILYVGLPNYFDRKEILKALTKNKTKPTLDDDVDIQQIADLTDGYTGADLSGLVRQASLQALKEAIAPISTDYNDDKCNTTKSNLKVNMIHFLNALKNIRPSVSEEDQRHYEKLRQKYSISFD